MKKTFLLILALAILVALAWALLWRTPSPPSPPAPSESLPTVTQESVQPEPSEAQESAASETSAAQDNPVEGEIPDLNPAAKTNPFGGAYKNPFE